MRILFLTQVVPYPPDAGPRIKTWHVLRYLAERGHEITLVTFVRPEEQAYLPVLRELCSQVYPVPLRRSRFRDVGYGLRSLITGRPFLIERDDLSEMRVLVHRLARTEQFDALHADQLPMAQFIETESAPCRIFDAHNATWTIFERMNQTVPWFLRPVIALEVRHIKRYEGQIVREFDLTLAVTENDLQALLEAGLDRAEQNHSGAGMPGQDDSLRARIRVVPIAVDTASLTPLTRKSGSQNILTLGTLHYPPNADGIRWFLREVFPLVQARIPAVSLTIIGRNPPQDFSQAASRSGSSIRLTGYVPELTPYQEQTAVLVIPVRAGGGMRVRILEAFARGMPVVTTTIGLEGIDAVPGRDVLVGDTPQDFAAAVTRLIENPDLQSDLARNGRALAENLYDWRVALQKLDRIYERIEPHQVAVECVIPA